MPVAPTYPGVYIQELPSQVRTITGVATSVAAFGDFFTRGPMNKAIQLLNMGDFEREFGGLNRNSEASYAIQQFFLNGGTEAWVVRTASAAGTNTPTAAQVFISSAIVATPPTTAPTSSALIVSAINEGEWGNQLRVRVDFTGVTGEFNLVISEYGVANGRQVPVRQEIFRNLSMSNIATNFVERVVNDPNTGSKLVRVRANGTTPPLANGTLSAPHTTVPTPPATSTFDLQLGTLTQTVTVVFPTLPAGISLPEALSRIASVLQEAIRAVPPQSNNPAFTGATVDVLGNRLRILPGPADTPVAFTFGTTPASTALLFTATTPPTATTANISEYRFGGSAGIANTALEFALAGKDGVPPDGTALIGNQSTKTGLYALDDVDIFNILCIPRTAGTGPNPLTLTQSQAVISAAINYCEQRRAFFIMDTPVGVDEPTEIKNWLAGNNNLRSRYAALYYPRLRIPDPRDEFRLRSVGASGTIAGLYARTDVARGVWKAPAGTEAVLRNVSEVEDVLTDQENGVLNPLAINCLRTFPIYGIVCWGARTLEGSDQQASQDKYIPVRRITNYIEESLYRGTKWVVFEPNDEPLWAQIRLNVGAFMHDLFRKGAFQGRTPQEAYFVKCDKETTTQTDINLGIVNILVGFAPLKPAEFVIITIQQIQQVAALV